MSDVVRVEVTDDFGEFTGVVEGLVPAEYGVDEASIYEQAFEDGVIAALNHYHAAGTVDASRIQVGAMRP